MTPDPRLTRAEIERIRDEAAPRGGFVRDLADTALAAMSERDEFRVAGYGQLRRAERAEAALRTAEARIAALEKVAAAARHLNRFAVIDLDEPEQIQAFDALTDALLALSEPQDDALTESKRHAEPQDGEGGRTPCDGRCPEDCDGLSPFAPTSPPASRDDHCACLLCEPSCGLIPTEGALCGECRNERHLPTSPPASLEEQGKQQMAKRMAEGEAAKARALSHAPTSPPASHDREPRFQDPVIEYPLPTPPCPRCGGCGCALDHSGDPRGEDVTHSGTCPVCRPTSPPAEPTR